MRHFAANLYLHVLYSTFKTSRQKTSLLRSFANQQINGNLACSVPMQSTIFYSTRHFVMVVIRVINSNSIESLLITSTASEEKCQVRLERFRPISKTIHRGRHEILFKDSLSGLRMENDRIYNVCRLKPFKRKCNYVTQYFF